MENWKAPDSVIETRRSICNECENYVDSIKVCTQCNCYVPFKTSVSFFECPINRWDKVN